jgi:hypothetical protein
VLNGRPDPGIRHDGSLAHDCSAQHDRGMDYPGGPAIRTTRTVTAGVRRRIW